jgi:hypothetical protein
MTQLSSAPLRLCLLYPCNWMRWSWTQDWVMWPPNSYHWYFIEHHAGQAASVMAADSYLVALAFKSSASLRARAIAVAATPAQRRGSLSAGAPPPGATRDESDRNAYWCFPPPPGGGGGFRLLKEAHRSAPLAGMGRCSCLRWVAWMAVKCQSGGVVEWLQVEWSSAAARRDNGEARSKQLAAARRRERVVGRWRESLLGAHASAPRASGSRAPEKRRDPAFL